ncbi:hypothetical protein [Nakamurella lactea]|uniref:hypothetical protein n=1 Tax=Nakamurella lactea TaxID=459515 RepID=UPI0012B5D459|nr:hypothetical protein [Nakamurella lactea]
MLRSSSASNELVNQEWTRLIDHVGDNFLRSRLPDIEVWVEQHPTSSVAIALSTKLVDYSEICRAVIMRVASSNGYLAVNALDSQQFPIEILIEYVTHWRDAPKSRIVDCETPGLGMGGAEPCEILTLASIKRPELAEWASVIEFLESGSVYGFLKRRPLSLIAANASSIPVEISAQVCAALDRGLPRRDFVHEFRSSDTLGGMPEVCRAMLGSVGKSNVRKQVERLALGTKRERSDCVDLVSAAGLDSSSFVLKYLSRDPVSSVRYNAQQALLYGVITRGNKNEFQIALSELADERHGISQSMRLVRHLVDTNGRNVSANRLAELKRVLSVSRSARVRSALADLRL